MLIGLRNAMLGGKRLPYDAEVEYLESTGTQWIGLPFGFFPTDEIIADFSIDTSQTTDKYINSPTRWNTSGNRFGMGAHDSCYTCAYGNLSTGNTHLWPEKVNNGQIHHWTYANKIVRITDVGVSRDLSGITFGAETNNLKLFYGYNLNTRGKVRSYRHIKNGQVACDLIAVRFTNEQGVSEGAMFDRANPTVGMNRDGTPRNDGLYLNRGTGAFVIGPDI